MRFSLTACLFIALVSFLVAISLARNLWTIFYDIVDINQRMQDNNQAIVDVIRSPLATLDDIAHFQETLFFENYIPDWRSSQSYFLFNHILPENQDGGASADQWQEHTLDVLKTRQKQFQTIIASRKKEHGKISVMLYSGITLCVFCLCLAVYIRKWLSHKALISELMATNQYLQKKQDTIRKSNHIMASILEDLNDERRRASFSRINDQRLALVAKYSDDALIGLDEEGLITSWNPKAANLFSKPEATMLDRPLHILFDEEDSNKILTQLAHITLNKPHASVTVKWISTEVPDVQYLEISITGLFSEQRSLGYSVIVRDVSSRIHEIEQLKILIEATPNAIIMSNENGNIIQANGHAEKTFGYSKYELLSLSIEDLIAPEMAGAHTHLRKNFLDNPSIRRMGTNQALRARCKGDYFIYVEVGLAPVKLNDKLYVISAITDISERLEAQNKLTEFNQSLAQKNKEMEQFVYTVSHDLKAPLVTINAFAKSIKKLISESVEERVIHKLDRVIANASRMEELITDLLEISRVMSRPFTTSQFLLNDAVTEVLESLEQSLKNITVTVNISAPLTITANRQQLIQCLQNIISNSAKYSRGDAPHIDIDAFEEKHYIVIAIKDDGLGIDPDFLPKMFDIFERGESDKPGNGVGLAIVKSIIEKHKGQINVASELNQGTEVRMSIPQPTNKEIRSA